MTKTSTLTGSPSRGIHCICKDHTLTGEIFELQKDAELDLLRTFPQPSAEKLPSYYQSENYISHTDAQASIFDKAYHLVKRIMLKKKISWIENEKPEKGKVLDIGAGTGDFLKVAKEKGWEAYGAEPSSQARSMAEKKKLKLVEDTSVFSASHFDVITMWHVLEHVPDLDAQITELKRLLKDDGLLVVAVPNFKSFDAEYYKEHWAAYDVPRHLYHFSRNAIRKIFSNSGFHLLAEKPLPFDSFYASLLSEKYKTGKTNMFRGIWTGLLSNLKARKSGEYSSLAYFLRKS